MPRWLQYLCVAVVAALAGYGAAHWLAARDLDAANREANMPAEESGSPSRLVGSPRPNFSLPALSGDPVSADAFDGEVLLVNFWATWCTPCRKEMPMLQSLQDELSDDGFRVVGIALDDEERVAEFVDDVGVDYTILVGGAKAMDAGQAWGNHGGMLPYSVLVDRDGVVRWIVLGELERESLIEQVEVLL